MTLLAREDPACETVMQVSVQARSSRQRTYHPPQILHSGRIPRCSVYTPVLDDAIRSHFQCPEYTFHDSLYCGL